jgi:acetyl-CoA C-acetyltransferase
LTIKGKAYIAGIYEHPTRHAPDKSTAQLHAEVAKGAIEDAGLTKADIDGYFCAGDAPGGPGRWSITSASRFAISIPPIPAAVPI